MEEPTRDKTIDFHGIEKESIRILIGDDSRRCAFISSKESGFNLKLNIFDVIIVKSTRVAPY